MTPISIKTCFIALATAFTLGACSNIEFEKDGVLDIYSGPGGNVAEHQEEIARLNAKGTKVRIFGKVVSADTMYLGANDVCLGQNAEFMFHGASIWGLGIKKHGRADAQLALHIPKGKLRDRFWNEYKHLRGPFLGKSHTAQEVHDMTGVPFC